MTRLWQLCGSSMTHNACRRRCHKPATSGPADPLINANYKNKSGAAVGYLTGELTQVQLSKV